jgi:hypothetical protein
MQAERVRRSAHLSRGSLLDLRTRSVPSRGAASGVASLGGAFPAFIRSNIIVREAPVIFVGGGHLNPTNDVCQLAGRHQVISNASPSDIFEEHLQPEVVSPPCMAQLADDELFCGFEGFELDEDPNSSASAR